MSWALLVARCVLALVFLVAAVAKLAGATGLRDTLEEFGVPRRVAGAGAIVLPPMELAVAVLLLPTATARWGAAAAFILLAAFCVAIGRSLLRGERPDCGCFGRVRSTPIGIGTLIRNVTLAAAAALVAVAGVGRSVGGASGSIDLSPLAVVVVAVATIVAVQAWFSWQLFRQNGRLLERIRNLEDTAGGPRLSQPRVGLPTHALAPPFALPDIAGRRRTLGELLAPGVPLALAFIDPDCGACEPLLPRLARLRDERVGTLELALITRGSASDVRARLNGHAFETVLLQERHEVAEAYGVNGVPSVVVITPAGQVATPLAVGQAAIEKLLGIDNGFQLR